MNSKEYYQINKEKLKKQAREYYHRNKEKVLEDVKAYRDNNREKIREKGREYYRRKPENRMLNRARARAKKYGLDFNLEESDIFIPNFCPLLGIPLSVAEGRKAVKDNSASLDRIDSKLGYIKGNVWVISHKANTIKSNATIIELVMLTQNLLALDEKGYCASLLYNRDTGRMLEIDEEVL